ncbi:MAG: lysophospholipid acyltransferase family protein [Proteobacteria bacterium]|nr:lysophospholipid acyltransferase family protein [Pseudomonadota bacterium]
MRRIVAAISLVFSTIFLSIIALTGSLFYNKGLVIHKLSHFWAFLHLKVCGIKVLSKGRENLLKPPYIIMCNHQSALDIFVLYIALPFMFKWVAKRQLFSIPFVGWIMKRASYVSLDRENPREGLRAINDAALKISKGMNIIVFPEGTRSKDGKLLPFKKGVFSLAVRAGVPVIPIGISGTSMLQPKGSLMPKEKGVIYVNIGKPILIIGDKASEKARVMDEVRASIERLMADTGGILIDSHGQTHGT